MEKEKNRFLLWKIQFISKSIFLYQPKLCGYVTHFKFHFFSEDKNRLEPVLLLLLQLPALPGSNSNDGKKERKKKSRIHHTLSMWYTGDQEPSKSMRMVEKIPIIEVLLSSLLWLFLSSLLLLLFLSSSFLSSSFNIWCSANPSMILTSPEEWMRWHKQA